MLMQAPMSTQSKPKPVYANFAVYKGKSALSLKVRSRHVPYAFAHVTCTSTLL